MLGAFRFGEIYFPASGHSEIGKFEALTSLLCCNPKKLLHGIDNDNGQSGLIFDLWSYKWFTKAQDSKLVVGFVNYMHKYRENSITHCKESFFCYCLQKCAFTLSRKTCDWNAAATWYFIFLLELNALTPKITISILLKVCCTSIIVSALRMWNKIMQFPFADI